MRKLAILCLVLAVVVVVAYGGWTRFRASLPQSDCVQNCCDNHPCTAAVVAKLRKP